MKKFVIPLLVLALLFSFCACGEKPDNPDETEQIKYSWPKAEWFNDVPKYSDGSISFSSATTAAVVSIKDTVYEDYVKYIEKLKKNGFEFFNNTGSDLIKEDYELSDGYAQWVCTDGTVYMAVIYIANDSSLYSKYDCNVRIYSYNEKPASWN